jgi:hypothetical protein
VKLTKAVRAGDLAQVVALLRSGHAGDVDGERDDDVHFTPLLWAARDGHVAIVAALLACGADPGAKDVDGFSARDYAARSKHREVVALLDGCVTPAPEKAKKKKPAAKKTAKKAGAALARFTAKLELDDATLTYAARVPAAHRAAVGPAPGRLWVRLAGEDGGQQVHLVTRGKDVALRLTSRHVDALGLDDGDSVEVEVVKRL